MGSQSNRVLRCKLCPFGDIFHLPASGASVYRNCIILICVNKTCRIASPSL